MQADTAKPRRTASSLTTFFMSSNRGLTASHRSVVIHSQVMR
jgi:hypothetical protein